MGKFATLGILMLATPLGCLPDADSEPAAPVPYPPGPGAILVPTPDFAGPQAYPLGEEGNVVGGVVKSARLEGRISGVDLANETSRNYGYLETGGNGQGWLDATVEAQGENGAGMIMLTLGGGLDHPVFQTGSWSSEEALATAEGGPYGEPYGVGTSVRSCAGPQLGEYPYEDQSQDYEMTAAADEGDPGVVVLVLGARFESFGASDVTATIRFDVGAEPLAEAGLGGLD